MKYIQAINKVKEIDKLAYDLSKVKLLSFANEDEKNTNQLLKLKEESWEEKSKEIQSIEKKYNFLINVLSVLSWLPIPVGNPFSLALAGDAMAKKNYLDVVLCIIGALPGVGSFGKVVSLARGAPKWVTLLLNTANRLGILSAVKPAILWLANTIKNVNLHKIITWDLYKKYVIKTLGQNSATWLFQKKSSALSINSANLFSFAGEEWVPNENFKQAQKELKDLGSKIEDMVNAASKGKELPVSPAKPIAGTSATNAPPGEELFVQQEMKLIKDRKFKSFTDEKLNKIKNDSKYELDKSDKDAIKQELDDREIDIELGITRG